MIYAYDIYIYIQRWSFLEGWSPWDFCWGGGGGGRGASNSEWNEQQKHQSLTWTCFLNMMRKPGCCLFVFAMLSISPWKNRCCCCCCQRCCFSTGIFFGHSYPNGVIHTVFYSYSTHSCSYSTIPLLLLLLLLFLPLLSPTSEYGNK